MVLPVNAEALQADHAKHRSLDLGENPWVLVGRRRALCASSTARLLPQNLKYVLFFVKK